MPQIPPLRLRKILLKRLVEEGNREHMSNRVPFRIGQGVDIHEFQANRPLILGGVHVPFERGLKGHSDADVVLHAIIDALLGALAEGDIGSHFPDTDEAYKDIDSAIMVEEVCWLVEKRSFVIANIDVTVILERPKLRPIIDEMRARIAELLDISVEQCSVKATTAEKLGFLGREEGIAATAVALLMSK